MSIFRIALALGLIGAGIVGIVGCSFDPGGLTASGASSDAGGAIDAGNLADAGPCILELSIVGLTGAARSLGPDHTPLVTWQSLPGCTAGLDIAVGTTPGAEDTVPFTSLTDPSGANLDLSSATAYRIADSTDGFALDLESAVPEYFITLRASGVSGTVTATSSGFSIPPVPAQVSAPAVWLDGADVASMYRDPACTDPATQNGDPVECWTNAGSGADAIAAIGALEVTSRGLIVDGDHMVVDSLFGGALNDVAIWIVHREDGDAYSFDINFNHPDQGGSTRYAAHVPWSGSERRIYWDAGGSRVNTERDVVSVGETHIYGLVNSDSLGQQSIHLDGDPLASGAPNPSAQASSFCYGDGAEVTAYEILVTSPAPNREDIEHIEGYLACKWNLRNQLPVTHRYHHATGDDDTGCP